MTIIRWYFDRAKIAKFYEAGKREYAELITPIPYIGGNENCGTYNLVGGAMLLAIIRSLEGEDIICQGVSLYLEM